MCGRITIISSKEIIEMRFNVAFPFPWFPNYNASPSQMLPIITNEKANMITLGQWGLLPPWAKGKKEVKPMINARSEGIEDKPFFRNAFKKNRCLVVADGYYEWLRADKQKIPYRICLNSSEPFAMAGLWETITDNKGESIPSFTIITTEANKLTSKIHHRMPVILKPEVETQWLDNTQSAEKAKSLLIPYPDEEIKLYPVTSKVNSAAYHEANAISQVQDNMVRQKDLFGGELG